MRIVLAGTGSAVGKTTIATGIMKALSEEYTIQPFKVGPDYIDPSYHTLATGNNSRNLDSFFMSPGQIKTAFERGIRTSRADFGIIEGVRGLYEGISPTGDVGNTASIAKALDAPVILIINARSLVKSAAAIVIGFKTLDASVKIEGVILNQVRNNRHYLKAKEAVETLAKTKVIGGIRRDDSITVEQRHLGLVPAVERENLWEYIHKWGEIIKDNLDMDTLISIMKDASKMPQGREETWIQEKHQRVKIGIPMDEVFNFYYVENLEALKANNADIITFSPFKDEEIPDVDALYIGGGYPEIFAQELEDNESMRRSILQFHRDDNPIYGECGGLMYLTRSINGKKMCGVFDYDSIMTKNVQGLSYVIAKANKDNIITKKDEEFRGHEFHYSKILLNGITPEFAFKMLRGKGITHSMDGLMKGNTVASYLHTHTATCPQFASNLIQSALK